MRKALKAWLNRIENNLLYGSCFNCQCLKSKIESLQMENKELYAEILKMREEPGR